jgi:hypothetical protein
VLVVAGFGHPVCGQSDSRTLTDAYRLFYNAHYEEAAALAESLRASAPQTLENDEVRTAALLFQLRGLLNGQDARDGDKNEALKRCSACASLLATFMADLHHGQALARTALKATPNDEEALFFLGKLDLNYVWLELGTLGHRTGWNEYWEARHSLDAALVARPDFLRARVARAWIDYIVDTRMPWGTGWLLGGGNKKKALAVMREAADARGDFYDNAEALFGLWDMQVREKQGAAALETARRLADVFPENPEVARFIAARSR